MVLNLLNEPPVLEPAPRPRPFMAMGTLGLKQTAGAVWEEFDPNLRGPRAIAAYQKMAETDPICGAMLWAIESVVRGVEWSVKEAAPPGADHEAEPSEGAVEGADFLRRVLFEDMRTPWHVVVTEALSALPYGWALHEVVYAKRDDGRIGIDDLSLRPQHTLARWLMDERGEAAGFVQRHPMVGVELPVPLAKCCHWRVRHRNRSPEGVSIFRTAYRTWVEVVNLSNVEAIGVERSLAGLPVARIPRDIIARAADGEQADQQILSQFVRMVRDLRMNEQSGVVLPSDVWPTPDGAGFTSVRQYDVELLSANSTTANSADPAIRRRRGEMATAVLCDFLMLGQGASGSWALSTDKTELFLQSLAAIVKAIEAEANRSIVAPLWALNGLPPEDRPSIVAGAVAPADAEKLASFVATLAGAGARMFPDTPLENHLRKAAGLPPMSKEAIEAGAAGAMPPPGEDPNDPFAFEE